MVVVWRGRTCERWVGGVIGWLEFASFGGDVEWCGSDTTIRVPNRAMEPMYMYEMATRWCVDVGTSVASCVVSKSRSWMVAEAECRPSLSGLGGVGRAPKADMT